MSNEILLKNISSINIQLKKKSFINFRLNKQTSKQKLNKNKKKITTTKSERECLPRHVSLEQDCDCSKDP